MKKSFIYLTKAICLACIFLLSAASFGQTVLINEIFDIEGGELDSDSLGVTDYSTLPAGWEVNDCYSSKQNYEASAGDATRSVLLKNNDSYFITPAVDAPGILTFWVKPKEIVADGVLLVEKSIDGEDYIEIGSVVPTDMENFVEFTFIINDPSTAVKLKFRSATPGIEEAKYYVDNVILFEDETPPSSINNLSTEKDFKILGNYVDNFLNFKTKSNFGRISVIDISGRLVMQREYSGTKSLDVSQLNSGIYFLRVKDSFGVHTNRFIKR